MSCDAAPNPTQLLQVATAAAGRNSFSDSLLTVKSETTRGHTEAKTENAAVLPRDSRLGVDAALGMKRLQDVQCFVLVLLAE